MQRTGCLSLLGGATSSSGRVRNIVKHWTDAELKSELANLTIICDTREQQNAHITKYFDDNKIPYKTRKIDTGDYSAMLGDKTLEFDCVIEKKNSLDEICGNLTTDRSRFEREFLRAKADKIKVFLIIENASWGDVFLGNYRSKFPPKSLLGSLLSWQVRFNVTIIFCKPHDTGKLIWGILYYYAREVLLHGW